MEVERSIPKRVQLAYGVGHVLNDVCASMWFSYLLVYFQLVLGAGAARAGLLLLIGQLADALATPFVGYHSDTATPSRYGRRKSWHLFGTICVLGAFPFIFSPCVGCAETHWNAQLVYYGAFVVLFQIGWACVQVSHLALIPELTSNQHQRTRLTAIRYSFTVFSNVVVYLVTWLVLHLDEGSTQQIGPHDAGKFQQVVYTGLALGGATSLMFHCLLRESPAAPRAPGTPTGRGGHALLLRRPAFYQVAVVYMCTRLSVNLWQAVLPLYLHNCLVLPGAALASVPLASFLASFVASLLVRRLNSGAGRKWAYCVGSLLASGGCVWLFLGEGPSYATYEIYCVAVLFGLGGAVMLVTSLGLTADLIGATTGTAAFVYGAMSFTDKLANGLAIWLIQHLSEGAEPWFYRWAVALGCGVPALAALVALLPLSPTLERDENTEVPEEEKNVLDEEEGEEEEDQKVADSIEEEVEESNRVDAPSEEEEGPSRPAVISPAQF